ncbi:hypothetical protein EG68_11016 [Paragonimus skrjabini miyazakii]|uniref:Uncharacterized protein n=1 Tax=Paragonimus skrjabini miyazakii TaxID=59628 RepID=A0A8S9YM65_9TREM|nr:hypothetical protein EG68_11016 [Paragonimus skrjabini miyazakii]
MSHEHNTYSPNCRRDSAMAFSNLLTTHPILEGGPSCGKVGTEEWKLPSFSNVL